MTGFTLDRAALTGNGRVEYIHDQVDINGHLDMIEKFINLCYEDQGFSAIQSGRVIALRHTDKDRLSSAFKSAIYLGKYKDMDNTTRFLTKMVSAGHSYEPIRGESILFLYIGIGKPVYDHLVTHSVGRTTRIAAGQRANLPWGYEVPSEVKGAARDAFMEQGLAQIRNVLTTVKGMNEEIDKQQIQAARSLLPVGYVMPPFLLEFSEEALITSIFERRLFESGAQGATVSIAKDMWNIVMQIDEDKWSHLFDHHGPHMNNWEKAMRTIRDKNLSVADLIDLAQDKGLVDLTVEYNLDDLKLYDMIMATVGKLPPSMWDKAEPVLEKIG